MSASEKKVYDYDEAKVRGQPRRCLQEAAGRGHDGRPRRAHGTAQGPGRRRGQGGVGRVRSAAAGDRVGRDPVLLPLGHAQPLPGLRPSAARRLEGLPQGSGQGRRPSLQGVDRRHARRLFRALHRAGGPRPAGLGGALRLRQLEGQPLARAAAAGSGGMFITGQLLNTIFRIWFYSELFMTPEQRAACGRAAGGSAGRCTRRSTRSSSATAIPTRAGTRSRRRPSWPSSRPTRASSRCPEFMALTGLGPLEAEARINRYLYEFEGSPEVTEGGTIYYFFPALLRRKDKTDRTYGSSVPMRPIARFSSNPKKANATFAVFNGVNLLFGSYFFFESRRCPIPLLAALRPGSTWPERVVTSGAGTASTIFTHMLFASSPAWPIPPAFLGIALGDRPARLLALLLRDTHRPARRLAARNERARVENLRRVAYRTVLDSPDSGQARVDSRPRRRRQAQGRPRRRQGPDRACRLVGSRTPGRRLLLLRARSSAARSKLPRPAPPWTSRPTSWAASPSIQTRRRSRVLESSRAGGETFFEKRFLAPRPLFQKPEGKAS